MRSKGITYDTGFLSAGTSTPWEPKVAFDTLADYYARQRKLPASVSTLTGQ